MRIHPGKYGLYFDGHTVRPITCKDRLGLYHYVTEGKQENSGKRVEWYRPGTSYRFCIQLFILRVDLNSNKTKSH